MGDVTGGERAAETIANLAAKLKSAKVRVGFLANSTYPNGTPVAMVAALNEYGRNVVVKNPQPETSWRSRRAKIVEVGGSYYQLPRPFFRNMIAAKKEGWPKAIAKTLKASNYDVEETLDLIGEAIKGQLQQSITELTSPPLAASTIARKGFAKPLVDTGHMLNSVDFEVVA